MGWTAPRPASMCAKMRCQTHLREAVHEKVYQEFVDCHDDRTRYREECVPGSWRRRRRRGGGGQIDPARATAGLLRFAAFVPGGDRSVQFGTSLGACADRDGPPGEADPAGLREAVCAAQ